MKMSKYFQITVMALWVIFVLYSGSGCGGNALAQSRSTKNKATDILRDSTVKFQLFHPDLRDTLVLQSASGNAPLADSAITLRLQKLTTGHFLATSLDSLVKLVIDSADFARFVRNGAITTRSAFSTAFLDTLQGDEDNYLILYARNARSADSSAYSDYSDESGTANYAIKYIGTDTIPAARYANIASYADVAGTALTQIAEIGAADWVLILDTIAYFGGSDSVQYAFVADSLRASALDDTGMISSTIRGTRLVLESQRNALNRTYSGEGIGAGAALSGTNPPIDSTGASKNFAQKYSNVLTEIGFSNGVPGAGAIVADTANTRLRYKDGSGDAAVFPDSAAIATMINTASDIDSADYIVSGLGSTPDVLQVGTSGPATNLGNMWVDTTAVTSAIVKVRTTSGWVSASGAAGTPTDVSLGRYGGSVTMDGDSFVVRSRPDTIIAPLRVTDILTSTDTLKSTGVILADSIRSASSSTIFIDDTITSKGVGSQRLWVGAESQSVSSRPGAFLSSLSVGGNSSGDKSNFYVIGSNQANIVIGETIVPDTSNKYRIGSIPSGGFSDASAKALKGLYAHNAIIKDTLLIADREFYNGPSSYAAFGPTTGAAFNGMPVTVTNTQLAIQGTGYLDVGGRFSAYANGDFTSQAGTTMNISGIIKVPSDTSNTFQNAAGTEVYYPLLDDEKNALRRPCPDISATNYVISKDWMKRFWTDRFMDRKRFREVKADSLAKIYWAMKTPACNDSLSLDPNSHNYEFIWPTVDGDSVIWPWQNNQQFTEPWITPGVPIGPYWISDSTGGNVLRYANPDDGLPEGKLQVSSRYDIQYGNLTGKWPTIQSAFDSLVNVRCALHTDVSSDGGVTPDTFRIQTRTTSYGFNVYHGNTACFATEKLDTLPDFVRKPGTYVRFKKANHDNNRWTQIQTWVNDSVFTIIDPVIGAGTALDNTWELTFSRKQDIEVLPPVQGTYVDMSTTITIPDYCPFRLHGTDKNRVVLSNKVSSSVPANQLFMMVAGNGDNNVYFNMPIEFSDLTFYSDSASTPKELLNLSGDVKIEDCNIIYKSSGTPNAAIIYDKNADSPVSTDLPTMFVENCTFIMENDMTCISIEDDSIKFDSRLSAYSVSGSASAVLYLPQDLYTYPSFTQDLFYFGDTNARLIECAGAQTQAKLPVPGCIFWGIDPSPATNVLQGASGFTSFLYSSSALFDASDLMIPAKLQDGTIPVKVPYSPK